MNCIFSSTQSRSPVEFEIEIKDDGHKGVFYIESENKIVAEMHFVWAGSDKIIIDHTDVDGSLKGKNVGKLLVRRGVLFAREKQIKILPLCPFAKSVFDKTEEYRDVLF